MLLRSSCRMLGLLFCLVLLPACRRSEDVRPSQSPNVAFKPTLARDMHSFSNPTELKIRHLDLDCEVLFSRKTLKGKATLMLDRVAAESNPPLILDTRDLTISKVEASADGISYRPATFALGNRDVILGSPLTVALPEKASVVRIEYSTSPDATALQWLDPVQTAGKKHPFLYTQSQSIHARSWIPLQDSPGVRMTYSATIHTPSNLLAVMSADHDLRASHSGTYRFNMPHPIPPYLMALAVGDLVFRPLSARTGIFAEPSVAGRAAREFADTEQMVQAVEKLYGPYRWGRYDLLVLPPSFPFGGMENPCLTFATPTVLVGDKSLVSLVAHELAHSWSGNLVTNATWNDFWLNEGFTTYLERRIIEAIYGRDREEMEAVLGLQGLKQEMEGLPEADRVLHIDLNGRNPDDGPTGVPYEKGALFLRRLEETFGRNRFDRFLRSYFDHFAFQSISTGDFVEYLQQNLLDQEPQLAARISTDEWIYRSGLPTDAPQPASEAFTEIQKVAGRWLHGEKVASLIGHRGGRVGQRQHVHTRSMSSTWSTQEWLCFLKAFSAPLPRQKMRELDGAFHLTKTENAEIAHQWLLLSIRSRYEPAYARLETYLTSIGRQRLIKPLYEELAKTPPGKARAIAIYRKARPAYHPLSVAAIDPVLGWKTKVR